MPEKQENIEDFVRKVVDQSEAQIPFNESHWLQMESMLDAQLPVVTNPGNGYYYFSNVVSLLVGLVFIWSWFIGFDTIAIPTSVQSVGEEVSSGKDGLTISEDLNSEEQVESVASSEEQSSKSTDVDQSRSVAKQPSENAAATLAAEERVSTSLNNTKNAIASQRETTVTSDDVQASTIEVSTNDIVVTSKSGATLFERDEEKEANDAYEFLSGLGIDLAGNLPDFPDQLDKVVIGSADGGSNESSDSPIVRRGVRSSYSRLSIGVSLAPDLSSNEIFRYNRLGRDLGIVVDYWIAPRLAISVGAFNTSKRYLVGGEEYSPPAGFWGDVTNGERPAKIDADCQVLDIPINLKYQLVDRPKLNVYASAGVSSYIMLQEDYQYELESGWKSEWGISNANQHFFGVGNLQVHFERRFGNHLAVEVAPFFKVPLTSYGHGNIRFHSMGSFFTIRKYLLNR